MLDFELLKNRLSAYVPKERIFTYPLTDSTNTRALEYARAGGESPAVFIAEEQTGGRGRRGRSFVSNPEAGIYITLLYTPKCSDDTERITARAAVALRRAIWRVCGVAAGIKWVNDLYAKGPLETDKKLSGILAEAATSEEGKIDRIAVGMGINVYKNAISDEISDIATSLEEVSGKRFSREDIILALTKEFYLDRREEDILREYRAASLTLNRAVTVYPHGDEPYDATVTEILDDYSLLVKTDDGETKRVFSGEVRTRLK